MIGMFFTARGMVQASSRIFSTVMSRVLKSPMSYIETQPIGRVLNRLGKDIDLVDSVVPTSLQLWKNRLLSVSKKIL